MTGIGPNAVVPAPPLLAPTNGLIVAAAVLEGEGGDETSEERWGNGLQFVPEQCGPASVFDPCSPGSLGQSRNRGDNVTYEPFSVDAWDMCGTIGFETNDYIGRARRALMAKEEKAVSHEFWTGALKAGNPHLSTTTTPAVTTLNGGAALARRLALAALVQAIADGDAGVGMIHATPQMVQLWLSDQALWRDGRVFRTVDGSVVVPGQGYTGSAPDGTPADATNQWAYATDVVQLERGAVITIPNPDDAASLAQASSHTTNVIAYHAYRAWAVKWNQCLHAAVKITTATA